MACFIREFDSPTTSMAVGTTGWFGGRPEIRPVLRVFSTTVERGAVPVTITLGDASETMTVPDPLTRFDPAALVRPDLPRHCLPQRLRSRLRCRVRFARPRVQILAQCDGQQAIERNAGFGGVAPPAFGQGVR